MDKKKITALSMVTVGIAVMIFSILCLAGSMRISVQSNLGEEKIVFENEQVKRVSESTTTQNSAVSDTISIPGLKKWTIPSGKTKVETNFYNPAENECYFVLTVTLTNTNEQIYQSKYLKPGQHLYEVELTKAMVAGEYEAVLKYDTYSIADNKPLNGASVPFLLVVN